MRKIFLFTLVMMLFLAACGGSETETETTEAETTTEETAVEPAEEADESVEEVEEAEETAPEPATSDIAATITIESWRNDDLAIWQDVIIPAFNAEHPEIEVIFAPSAPAEYNGVLNTKLTGGTAGDLITCRPFDASLELFDAGYLASLNDLDGMDNFGDVAKSAWVTDDGSDVFCVPMASVIHGFIYNQDLFTEAGVEAPETVDEFFAVMDALDAAGITPLDMGTADQWEAATMGFQNVGPNYWNGEDGRLALISGEGKLTDQAYVDTLAQLARWGDYLPSGFEAQTYPDSQNLFTLGQAAIYPAGSWDISMFNDQADFELGAFMPPVQAAGDPCYISDHTDIALGMNANTENPEAVRTFLTWVASAEFANLYSNALPGFFSLSNAEISIDDPIAQAFVNWRGECDSTIRNSYQILSRGEPNLENELWRVSAQVINGDITPEEGAQQLQDGLDVWYTPGEAAVEVAETAVVAEADPNMEGELVIESWRNDDLVIWEDVIIPAFNEHYPNIEVIFAPSAPAEYDGVLNTKLEGGTAGDLITCRPFDRSLALFDAGYLASLSDLDGMDNFGDVAKSAWITDDGSDAFCVPMASVIHGFIYNQDLFVEAGVDEPETVDDFFAVLDALDAAGITPLDMGTADQWEAATMGFQNVGPNYWMGEDGRLALISGEGKLTDPEYVATLEQLARWGDYLPSGFQAQTYPDSQNLFTLGQAAIYPAGSWDISLFNDQADFELGAFMPPVPNAGDPCYISDHTDIALGMNPATENADAAKAFLNWVASSEFAGLYSNALPGFFSLSETAVDIDDPLAQEFVSWRGECDSTIRNSYQILSRGEPNLENELWRVSAQVINGDITAEEGAQQLQDGLDIWYTP